MIRLLNVLFMVFISVGIMMGQGDDGDPHPHPSIFSTTISIGAGVLPTGNSSVYSSLNLGLRKKIF